MSFRATGKQSPLTYKRENASVVEPQVRLSRNDSSNRGGRVAHDH